MSETSAVQGSRLRSAMEVVGLVAVVAGLGFVGYEINQTRQLSISERIAAFVEVEVATRGLLAEHAALWRKGCETTELSASEETEFTQLVQALYFKEFVRWWVNTTDVGTGNPSMFARDFALSMYHFPGFRAAVDRLRRPESAWMLQVDEFLTQIESDPSLFRDVHPATCGI